MQTHRRLQPRTSRCSCTAPCPLLSRHIAGRHSQTAVLIVDWGRPLGPKYPMQQLQQHAAHFIKNFGRAGYPDAQLDGPIRSQLAMRSGCE
jgi:hypothetical protein